MSSWTKIIAGATLISATTSWTLHSQTAKPSIPSSDLTARTAITRLIEEGRLQEAREHLKLELSRQGETHDTLYLEALILFREKQYGESSKKLQRSLTLRKDDPEAHLLLARDAVVLNQMELAETSLKTSIHLAPDDYLPHLHLGLLYFTTYRFSLAENEFQTVVRLNPAYMKGYDLLGLAQEELEGTEVIIATYRKAIELADQQHLHDDSPYVHLAKFLWRKNRFPESLPLAQKAVTVNPKSTEAYYVLGMVLDKLGQTEQAVTALQESTQIDPQNSEAHYLLSRIYLKQGKQEEAQKEMQLFTETRKNVKGSP